MPFIATVTSASLESEGWQANATIRNDSNARSLICLPARKVLEITDRQSFMRSSAYVNASYFYIRLAWRPVYLNSGAALS